MYAWLVVFNQAQKFASIQVQVKAPEGPQTQITVSKPVRNPQVTAPTFSSQPFTVLRQSNIELVLV
jgi:hypothetical protein